MSHSHSKTICQHGWTHSQCRCPGPKIVKTVVCDVRQHALSPGAEPKPVFRPQIVPNDVEEYITGEISDSRLTRGIWDTLLAALQALDNAYGNPDKIDAARDWLHEQYGDWED